MISKTSMEAGADVSLALRETEARHCNRFFRAARRFFSSWWRVEIYSTKEMCWLPTCTSNSVWRSYKVLRYTYVEAYTVAVEHHKIFPREEVRIRRMFTGQFIIMKLASE